MIESGLIFIKRMISIFFIIITLFSYSTVFAATYYIDYDNGSDSNMGTSKNTPWKRVPGMVGFSGSFTHQPGDTFIFKGGIIWPSSILPFTITYSGSSGNIDTYTTDHTWYNGVTWSQPVIDGESQLKQLLTANEKSYFTIDDIKFIGVGTSGVENNKKAIEISNSHHYIISNCTIAPQAWIGLYLYSISGSSKSFIRVLHNDISAAGQGIVLATAAPNTQIDDIHIYNNDIHDLTSQIVGSTHGDGIHTWNSPSNDTSQVISNLKIYNNKFYGDFSRTGSGTASMTALIFIEDNGTGHEIFNNDVSYSKRTDFTGLIYLKLGTKHKIFNNTLYLPPSEGGEIGILVASTSTYVIIKNNIISGAQYAHSIYGSGVVIDFNCINTTGTDIGYWLGSFKSFSEWQAVGNDTNGINSAPLFISTSNLHLQAGSQCGNTGTNLSTFFTSDKDGLIRPTVSGWSMGAYQWNKPTPPVLHLGN